MSGVRDRLRAEKLAKIKKSKAKGGYTLASKSKWIIHAEPGKVATVNSAQFISVTPKQKVNSKHAAMVLAGAISVLGVQ